MPSYRSVRANEHTLDKQVEENAKGADMTAFSTMNLGVMEHLILKKELEEKKHIDYHLRNASPGLRNFFFT